MKINILSTVWILITCSISISKGQNWQDIGGLQRVPRCMFVDSVENVLYIGGHFFVAGNDKVGGIAKWDGHQFHSLGCGVNWGCNPATNYFNYGGSVLAIARYHNEIYVTGEIGLAGNIPVKYIARWNGTTWDSVGKGLQWPGNMLTVIDDELYVGGAFDSAGGIRVNSLAKWNGSQWSDVHNMPSFWSDGGTNYVNAVAKYKGELYVGGNFNNGTIKDIVKFDGTNWVSVGGGLLGSLSFVGNMVVYKNELYVAGAIYQLDGNAGNFIQRWDGTQWKDVGGGTTHDLLDPGSNGQIHDMKVHNNELYIAGVFNYAGGIPAQKIAKWNGTSWCGFGGNFDNNGTCLGFLKDTLYLGGAFWYIDSDSITYIAKLSGGTAADTCSNFSGIEQLQSDEQMVTIFPNPATNTISINGIINNSTVNIYDISGKLLLYKQLSSNQLDISHLARGMYFIKLTTSEGSVVRKFIKE